MLGKLARCLFGREGRGRVNYHLFLLRNLFDTPVFDPFTNPKELARKRFLFFKSPNSNTFSTFCNNMGGKNSKKDSKPQQQPTSTGDGVLKNAKEISEEEWKQRLPPQAFFCSRQSGTERAFTGEYVENKATGVYLCVCCRNHLFKSSAKFDSGSGWPSFYDEMKEAEDSNACGILRKKDDTHGMSRTELLCKNCNGHLGHLFDDGPPPTRLRYCINSSSLEFRESSKM